MWYLIGFVSVVATAGIYWSYKRKVGKRTAARAREFEVLLAELKRNPQSTASGTAVATAPVPATVAAAPDSGWGKKQRLLPQHGALLYFVFRTGLPDHEIFANLTLADLIDIEPAVRGYEREQKARRLAQQRLDLVICTKQLEVVAAVLLDAGTGANASQPANAQFTELCLQAAGIRLVRIDSAAPPRHHQVRELIYGAG